MTAALALLSSLAYLEMSEAASILGMSQYMGIGYLVYIVTHLLNFCFGRNFLFSVEYDAIYRWLTCRSCCGVAEV
jgi:hypothetical protein